MAVRYMFSFSLAGGLLLSIYLFSLFSYSHAPPPWVAVLAAVVRDGLWGTITSQQQRREAPVTMQHTWAFPMLNSRYRPPRAKQRFASAATCTSTEPIRGSDKFMCMEMKVNFVPVNMQLWEASMFAVCAFVCQMKHWPCVTGSLEPLLPVAARLCVTTPLWHTGRDVDTRMPGNVASLSASEIP